MKNTLLTKLFSFFTLALIVTSCGKDDDPVPPPTGKKVKYELSGNYTGQFTVAYTQASGSNGSATTSTLPWSTEITITSFPGSAGLGTSAVVGKPGIAGQTVKATIYLDGSAVQTSTQTAGADGYIYSIPTLAHVVN